MLPNIIQIREGYSIDYRFPEGPCPRCGGRVYHVYEDEHICYCTAPFCHWHDQTWYSKYDL